MTVAPTRILVVEDDSEARGALRLLLSDEGYEVSEAADGPEGLRQLQAVKPVLVLCDVFLPGFDGVSLIRQALALGSDAEFVVISGHPTVERAVEAMRAGAHGYVVKPLAAAALLMTVEKALETRTLVAQRLLLNERMREKYRNVTVVGESPALQAVFELVSRVAPSRATVLILGESGTGKELVAQAIHAQSPRRDRPFIKVNCGALSETLLESELFGHEKGSFTGAIGRREGRFELADGGTLFLDEIGDVSPGLQVKLLRVLQQHELERVGGTQTVKVDVRVVAATHKNLEAEVEAGRFRRDLYYRLNVVALTVPALRDHKSDIPDLVDFFIDKYATVHGKPIHGLAPGMLSALQAYAWPGNVRELGNVIERAVVLSASPLLTAEDLPANVRGLPRGTLTGTSVFGRKFKDVEEEAIVRTLELVGGSTTRAAQILDISVRKIQYRLNQYADKAAGLDPTVTPAEPQ